MEKIPYKPGDVLVSDNVNYINHQLKIVDSSKNDHVYFVTFYNSTIVIYSREKLDEMGFQLIKQ
jgi:hypothetical protein